MFSITRTRRPIEDGRKPRMSKRAEAHASPTKPESPTLGLSVVKFASILLILHTLCIGIHHRHLDAREIPPFPQRRPFIARELLP